MVSFRNGNFRNGKEIFEMVIFEMEKNHSNIYILNKFCNKFNKIFPCFYFIKISNYANIFIILNLIIINIIYLK